MAEMIFLVICGFGTAFLLFTLVNWWIEWRSGPETRSAQSLDVEETIGKVRKRIALNRELRRHH